MPSKHPGLIVRLEWMMKAGWTLYAIPIVEGKRWLFNLHFVLFGNDNQGPLRMLCGCVASSAFPQVTFSHAVYVWHSAGLVGGASQKGRALKRKGRQALRSQTRAQQHKSSRSSLPSSARRQRKKCAFRNPVNGASLSDEAS